MKSKIFLIVVLVLSIILGCLVEAYAAQARAYATVLIIIPPKEEKAQEYKAEEKDQETRLAQSQTDESKEP